MSDSSSVREEDVFARPTVSKIRSTWKTIFSDPLISVQKLKAAGLSKAGLGTSAEDGGVILRSVYWRFYHGLLPPPTSLDLFPPTLELSRQSYTSLRRRYLIAPDGRWAADCSGSEDLQSDSHATSTPTWPSSPGAGPSRLPAVPTSPILSEGGWDPLSLDGASPWKTWFAHLELRGTIRQDVERTFPDIPYFQVERVRKSLTTMLFLYAVLNPDVGYRQGMHELLAVCFMTVDRDSIVHSSAGGNTLEDAMAATLDRRFVEHDTFALFLEIMKSAKAFYEWRAEEGPRTKSPVAPQAPIIIRCNNLHHGLIRRIDPQLWERLENEGVEAQIWAIRWLRLIFTRELPFSLALRLWDGIFAEDPGLGIIDYICVAMLLLIRNELIEADYPTLLTHLLHYPSPSPEYPFEPSIILAQALLLRNGVSPATGVEVVMQNRELLGVQSQPPERPVESQPLRGRGGLRGARGGGRPQVGVQSFAQGWIERAQAAGLDKAILSTVADLRKNLPDTAAAYSYLPTLPFSPNSPNRDANAPFSSIPTTTSALPSRSYFPSRSPAPSPVVAADPSTIAKLRETERQIAELRLAMMGMGKAMSEWLEVVGPSLSDPSPEGNDDGTSSAWSGLARVKDTLIEAAAKDVEAIVKEWAWHEGLEAPRSRSVTPAPMNEAEDSISLPSLPQNAVHHPQSPIDHSASEVLPGQDTDHERTPVAPSVAVLPPTPSLPTFSSSAADPPTKGDYPPRSDATNVKPATPMIHLGHRDDKPVAGLTRVPLSASPRVPNGWTASAVPERVNSTNSPRGGHTGNGDPLAGLGVSAAQVEKRGRWGGGGGGDPLGAA